MESNGNGHGHAPTLERSIKEPMVVVVPGGQLTQRPGESETQLGARADEARAGVRRAALEPRPADSHLARFRRCFEAAA